MDLDVFVVNCRQKLLLEDSIDGVVEFEASDLVVECTSGFRDLGASGVGWEGGGGRRCGRRWVIGIADTEGLIGDLADGEDEVS